MARPPRARESVLDAFEQLLVDEGERAATMDATAHVASIVSTFHNSTPLAIARVI